MSLNAENEATLLHHAVQRGNIKFLRHIIKRDAELSAKNNSEKNIQSKKKKINVNAKDENGLTPLHYAAKTGNVEVLKLLLEADADVSAKDNISRTPIHVAATNTRNVDIFRILIDAGADVDDRDLFGCTPLNLSLSTFWDSLNVLKFLVEVGADVNAKDKIFCREFSLLHLVFEKHNVNKDTLRFLLEAGVEVNSQDYYDCTPLHAALNIGVSDEEVLRILLDAGADINARNISHNTPLHCAILSKNNINVIKFLVENGADIRVRNTDGQTPLHAAANTNNLDIDVFRFLISAGANVNDLCSDDNETTLTVLIENKTQYESSDEKQTLFLESIKFLIEYSDLNLTNKRGDNILSNILESNCIQLAYVRKFLMISILKHVAKLLTLDCKVDTSLLKTITSEKVYSKYFLKCSRELEKANHTKISNSWVTFFNLLIDDESKFVKYAGNEHLIQDFKKRVKQFPIYGKSMKRNVLKGIKERKLFDCAANMLSYYCPVFDPCHLVVRGILDCLNEEDWRRISNKND